GDYALPPLALLDAPKTERKIDERELMDSARLLEEKCREFAVEGSVVQIHPGPVVTTFEFKPEAGVKYAKITSLAEDLCLAMQAESVLIDRIPGKSTVGIQISNHNREQISLRELLESDVYRRSQSKLTLAAEGVRNIDQYNRNIQQRLADKEAPENGEPAKPLPFIVVVIDELADLMMVASNEVEESIARLAQMARAVGIHLILATQRPSVDVITGLIKANLPARMAFRVASKIDSRTILDGNGAEQLLGKGDMLFLPPASSRFIRLHGPYISEQESARLASFLRKQGKPTYDETITAEEKTAAEGMEFDKDDLYDEAARIVVGSGQASISYLQRRLRIGFSRAARLVDMMEMEGLVSPAA